MGELRQTERDTHIHIDTQKHRAWASWTVRALKFQRRTSNSELSRQYGVEVESEERVEDGVDDEYANESGELSGHRVDSVSGEDEQLDDASVAKRGDERERGRKVTSRAKLDVQQGCSNEAEEEDEHVVTDGGGRDSSEEARGEKGQANDALAPQEEHNDADDRGAQHELHISNQKT